MTLKEKGSERIIRSGESWTENPGDMHSVVNTGTTTARVVVNILLPKGAVK
jgi:quercetin dioxygenase-like cupin family protein